MCVCVCVACVHALNECVCVCAFVLHVRVRQCFCFFLSSACKRTLCTHAHAHVEAMHHLWLHHLIFLSARPANFGYLKKAAL